MEEARSDQALPRPAQAVRRRRGHHPRHRGRRPARHRRSHREMQGGAAATGRYSLYGRLRGWRLGMAELTYRDAVARGIAQEMARDPDVIFFGEDVAKAGGGVKGTGGVFG